ncbi:MAG TPA: chemotaxis protein CheB [Chitinophagaceae bacterium]|nr:chemotaxis protein CheB [Chitinophagaceae bacterium]
MAEKQVKQPTKLVVIGGSSGSLDALVTILPALKKNFSIPVLLIIHRSNAADSGLTDLLASRTSLKIKEVDEKEYLQPGWIYLAPPDYHVLLEEDGSLSLDASEKVFYCRPSIEVSFTSAAQAYGEACIAVLLSGANADGAAAMNKIKAMGGKTIVQDPAEAVVAYMPSQAIQLAAIDEILPAAGIAAFLNTL